MNLRRILQGAALICCIAFFSTDSNAQQAQLAGVNQDGLVQLGSNHPFVVENYVISLRSVGVSSTDEARNLFRKYIEEGFTFSFDLQKEEANMRIDISRMYDTQSVPVSEFNQKLRDIHRIRR
jgi:hypothetical protein